MIRTCKQTLIFKKNDHISHTCKTRCFNNRTKQNSSTPSFVCTNNPGSTDYKLSQETIQNIIKRENEHLGTGESLILIYIWSKQAKRVYSGQVQIKIHKLAYK